MKKTPVVFPLMPGETQEDRKREEENMAKYESVDEWTLCLRKRDVPGSAQSESDGEKDTEENDDDREGGEEAEESRPKDEEKSTEEKSPPKDRKVKISEKAPIADGERGRRFMARRSIPQLRVSHFMESGAETSGEEGYFTDDWTLQLPLYNVPQDPLLAQNERRIRKSTSHSPAGTSFPDEERRRATSCTSAAAPKFVATRYSLQTLPRSSLVVRPSIDELTLRDPGPEPSAPLPPVPSEAVAFPAEKQDKLTPPSSSSARLSYCSNGSADARASMISVASMASRTTSSTTTVVPGQWQREQMEQKAEWSRSSFASQNSEGPDESAILNQWGGDDSPRERRLSAFSVRTTSTARSSAEFVAPRELPPPPPPPNTRSARRSMFVAKIPLPFGREAEKRARTISMGPFRRTSSGIGAAPDTANPPKRSFSSLSKEWKDGLAEGDRDKKRDSTLSMPGHWLSVASREGSVRSVQTAESGGSRRRVDHRANGSDLFDDGASGRSGTYYSARSSFSTSG